MVYRSAVRVMGSMVRSERLLELDLPDEEAIVKRWDSLPIIPSGKLTLGEAYRSRTESGMISLEEGVVDHWSWAGRIALCGDAAHKFTPSTGKLMCNTLTFV